MFCHRLRLVNYLKNIFLGGHNNIGVSFPFPVKYDMSIGQRVDLKDKYLMMDNCHIIFFLYKPNYVANRCC